jgi:phosphonate transport system substrate-binding protein
MAIIVVALLAMLIPSGASAENEFLIGLIPEENIFKQISKHKPLEAYLSDKLGVKVRFTILSRYPDIIDRFLTREMDGAFFGIFTSILAQGQLGVEPIARPVNLDGSSTAKAYVFTRKDSGIRNSSDMKGKRAVFVDKATATGYLYLLSYLREHGITNYRSHFSDYSFTGSHDSTVYSVLSGRADVGIAKSRILEKLRSIDPLIQDEILIISTSKELPDITLCVRQNIPREFKDKLTGVLIEMHKSVEGKKVLKSLEAQKFVRAHRKDFKAVHTLTRKAGIKDLKKFDYR